MRLNFTNILLINFLLFSSLSIKVSAQEVSENIRLNQIGFYTQGPKIAVILEATSGGNFHILKEGESNPVYTGTLSKPRKSLYSGKTTRIADFSSFSTPGTYVMEVPGEGKSYPFEIKDNAYEELGKASIKAFYFHRVSSALPEKYAGKWARPEGHPDNKVIIHSSAASPGRPAGSTISSPKGWYDAGDYNKYIVNSGITVGTMLSAYEDFPEYFKTLNLNIPESKNTVPDLLDEVLWNLRWMATMQDPQDGGVYHKLTNPSFDSLEVMPHEAKNDRYVVQKSTAAALNFAAVMAQASRVFNDFKEELPGLSDSCLNASKRAWEWAQKNPDVLYEQNDMNKKYTPPVSTGTYGDKNVSDEFIWAAAELYVSTRGDQYLKAVNLIPQKKMVLPSWNQVRALAYYTLLRKQSSLTEVGRSKLPEINKMLINFADSLISGANKHAFNTVMGTSPKHFIWGSSSVAANQAIALIYAYKATSNKKYLHFALHNLDYLLGRNATGYSFVTGFGEKSVKNPHQRPAIADNIDEPIPGWLSGGPNASAPKQDNCNTYTSKAADETFTDDSCSYASNEVAINWNAPFVYVANALEALQKEGALTKK